MAIAETKLWYRRLSRLERDNFPGNALDTLAVCNTTLQPNNIQNLLQNIGNPPSIHMHQ